MPEENQDLAAEVRSRLESLDKFMDGATETFGTVAKDVKGLNSEILKLKQMSAGGGGFFAGRGPTAPETPGSLFTKSAQLKLFRETNQKHSGKFVLEAKAVTPITAPPYPVPVQRVEGSPNVYAPLTLRQLLRPVSVGSGQLEYLRQKPTVGGAAIQFPQGTLKASVTMDFELATANICTVAAYTKAARQVVDDDAQLQSIIDGELQHLVDLAEELEILSGPGGPGRMEGILTLAPVFTPTTGVSPIDNIGKAIGQLQAAGYVVSAVVMNALDWVAASQSKATPGGQYLLTNPGQSAPLVLWNTPVILSSNITAGTFLVGAFGSAAQLYDRETRLDVSDSNEDDFVKTC